MTKYLGIDYGKKRCGLAITDTSGMIASAFGWVETRNLLPTLATVISQEKIDVIVVGRPVTLSGKMNEMSSEVDHLVTRIKKEFPAVEITTYDERFTSVMAGKALLDMGAGKLKRMQKHNTDVVSAVIMLRDYLAWLQHKANRHA